VPPLLTLIQSSPDFVSAVHISCAACRRADIPTKGVCAALQRQAGWREQLPPSLQKEALQGRCAGPELEVGGRHQTARCSGLASNV